RRRRAGHLRARPARRPAHLRERRRRAGADAERPRAGRLRPAALVTEGSWGVTPVPERLRTLSTVDQTMLWANLGVSLLVLVLAAALVPAMSPPKGLLPAPARRPSG